MATVASDAYDQAAQGFPGLLGFQFHNRSRAFLSSAKVWLDDVHLGTVRSSGHDIRLVDDDRVALLVPITGTIQVARGGETRIASSPDLLVVGTGERSTRLSGDYLGLLVKVLTRLFRQRLGMLAQTDNVGTLEGLNPASQSTHARTLRRLLMYLVEEIDTSPLLIQNAAARLSSKSLLVDLAAAIG